MNSRNRALQALFRHALEHENTRRLPALTNLAQVMRLANRTNMQQANLTLNDAKALCQAIRRLDTHIVSMILHRLRRKLPSVCPGDRSPLTVLVDSWDPTQRATCIKMLDLLLAAGANINERHPYESAPMLHYALRAGLLQVAEHLILKGAHLELKSHGDTAFRLFLQLFKKQIVGKDPEVLRVLRAFEARGKKISTVLALQLELLAAITAGDLTAIEKALKAGAKPNRGFDPFLLTAFKEYPLHAALLSQHHVSLRLQIVQLLLRYGANPNGVPKFRYVPLREALQSTAPDEVVKALVKAGARLDRRLGKRSMYPLQLAFYQNCSPSLVKFLVAQGADASSALPVAAAMFLSRLQYPPHASPWTFEDWYDVFNTLLQSAMKNGRPINPIFHGDRSLWNRNYHVPLKITVLEMFKRALQYVPVQQIDAWPHIVGIIGLFEKFQKQIAAKRAGSALNSKNAKKAKR